ncbi:phosphatidylinositol kinase [Aureococcus anophagefferens]|nr:phosphatidylinositol kinase [Aureococcus anophagefferens]
MAEIIQVNWKHATAAEKARRVRVVKGLVEHLAASDAAKYAHKVLGVLSAALDEGSGELSAVSEVGDGAATLKRAMAKRASELLHWLLVERRAVLGPAFASVPRLPDVPGNAVVDACRAALVDERAKTANLDAFLGRSQHEPVDVDADGGDAAAGPASLRSELQRLAPLLEADAPGVRAAAATALSETLTARHDDFAALVFSGDVGQARTCVEINRRFGTPDQTLKFSSSARTPEVDDVASALLRGAARGARDRRFRLAVATALGDLGALDPALVRVSLHARSDPTDADAAARRESSTRAARAGTPNPATSGKKKRRENEADELREPDRSAFAIQELLKLMDPDADDAPAPKGPPPPSGDDRAAKRRRGTPVADGSKRKRRGAEGLPDWARKIFAAGDCYETVLTYAATTYAIALPPRERKARQEFVASSGHDARLWVKSWARHLAVFARSRTHAPVFVACHALMRDDDRLCAALLPYLVADALCCGEDADALDVARELTKALEVAADPVVLNLVFSLHATIERWHDAARALEREDAARARSRGAVPATADRFACFVDEDGAREAVSELLAVALEALPPAKLADAAASIGADARSWHDGADGYVPVLGQADIEQLEVVACRLDDDADYLGGLSACRRRAQMPGTLRQRVREMEQEAQWQQALDGYEHVLRAAEGAARADAARGLLERDARDDGGGDARVALATCVAALQTRAATGDAGPFRGAVDAAKLAAMERLSASTESYGRAYPYVAQLHAIREVEHAAELLDDPDARDSVLRRWDDRLLAGAKTSAAGWLAVRRVCLEVAGLPEDAGTCAMRSAKASALALAEAKLARCAASGGGDTEAQAALRAYAMLEPVEADLKAIAMKFGVSGWSADDLSGLALFKGHERHRGALVASQSKLSAADRAERADVAKRLVLATDCLVDARLRHGVFAVVKRYELAVALRPDWARAYVSCGRYFDVLLASRRQQTSSDDDDDAGDDGGDVLAHEYAKAAMTWYARGLEQGAKEAPSALPRLTERAKALERLKQEIYDVVRRASLSIPAAVWYTVTPQLVSRAAHPNPSLMRGVSELLAIILHAHPDEAVWAVTGLTQSLNPDRKKVGSELFSLAAKRLQKSDAHARDAAKTQKMLHGAKQLFADLIAVAKHVPPDSAATVDMRRIGKQVKAARGLLVPTRAALTAAIAPRGKGGGPDWPRFPDDLPRVDKFQDNIIVMKSKAKPKKLTLEASNGRVVRVLCKREKDGDLRKDARVNDFNDVVNRLLDADDEARRRKLHLRTFAVVILDEECGLMEWVNRTHGLRFVMEAAYGLHPDGARRMPGCFDDRIRGPFEQNQRTYAHDGVAMAREYRKIVLGQYEPCFSRWFAHRFGDEPAAWLGARATFARSSAIWSAVGHVLGLGDRHGENIMVDIDRGEQVHVDFDCIFDKGTRLKTPEIVPFRLTPHMVEAFGVTGVEGCFRRSLEAQRDGGPDEPPDRGLGDRNGAKAATKKRAPPPPKAHDDPKNNVLRVVAQRLDGIYNVPVPPPPGSAREREDRALARARGVKKPDELPLSVPGQVERLIKEATADTNLCRMYIGWTPFL